MSRKLTARQQAFVDALLADPTLSHKDAAIKAGYSPRSAKQTAHEMLQHDYVREKLDKRRERASEKADLTAAWVLERLRENVERSMQAEPVLDREGNPTGLYTYQGAVANGALQLIGKQLGMFEKKVRLSFENPDDALAKLKAMPKEQRVAAIREMLEAG